METWRTDKTEELFNAFLKLGNTDEVASFCRDLMTEPELDEFASRFQIAKMLHKGISQRKIAKELEVSITTVTRVNQWLMRGQGGYKNVLGKLVTEDEGKTGLSNQPKADFKSEKHHHRTKI